MNTPNPIRLTAAETALVDNFAKVFTDLPGDGAVVGARDRLIKDLRSRGLPTRRVEAWHYTDLKSLLKPVVASAPAAIAGDIAPLVEGSDLLVIRDGKADVRARASGLTISVLSDKLRAGGMAESLAPRGADDAIGQINGAFVSDGYVIDVPAGASPSAPVEIRYVHGAGAIHSRSAVTVGAGSQLTLIERHKASGAFEALVTHVSDLAMADKSAVTAVILIEEGVNDTHLGQINVTLAAEARLTLYIVNTGGRLVRQEVHVNVEGSGADFRLRCINLLGGDSHCDVTMTLGHNVPETTSTEIIRNVVMDRAKGVFQGQIRVAPDAQKTDARMACNTLLLSDEAEFSTKPELEIFADDVQCAHGATVADIDHTQLFYLQARGITEGRARGLLVQAFVAEIIEELEDEALVAPLEAIIETWLEAHA